MPRNAKALVDRMTQLRLAFSPGDAGLKAEILSALRNETVRSRRLLEKYHEALCFMQAYPDNPAILANVDSELAAFGDRVALLARPRGKGNPLDDTGIAMTTLHHIYSLEMARWLSDRFGPNVDVDWDAYDEQECDAFSGLLPLIALYLENDGIDDPNQATSEWIKNAVGQQNSLRWLIDNLDRMQVPVEVKRYIFDNAEVPLRWNLAKTNGSRTLAKTPTGDIYYQQSPLQKERIDLQKSIRKSPPSMRLLPPAKAKETIAILIRALLPRHRELWPATYSNPGEVYVMNPWRGLNIYLFGMLPESRMPLESNYAALLIRNGAPIGYGISVLFFAQCEIAINVFDTFRSGEAGAIFAYFVRVFYHHFGARELLVRDYQVGHENEEGIESGAYWFYYKMGLRSLNKEIDALARVEWEKIAADRTHRTDRPTLRRLAKSDLYIPLGGTPGGKFTELRVIDLSAAVTKAVASWFDGDRRKASRHFTRALSRAGLPQSGLTKFQRMQYERFAPLLSLIDDLPHWSRKEKSDLLAIIKAKAAPTERDYIFRLQAHEKLKVALRRLAEEKP